MTVETRSSASSQFILLSAVIKRQRMSGEIIHNISQSHFLPRLGDSRRKRICIFVLLLVSELYKCTISSYHLKPGTNSQFKHNFSPSQHDCLMYKVKVKYKSSLIIIRVNSYFNIRIISQASAG